MDLKPSIFLDHLDHARSTIVNLHTVSGCNILAMFRYRLLKQHVTQLRGIPNSNKANLHFSTILRPIIIRLSNLKFAVNVLAQQEPKIKVYGTPTGSHVKIHATNKEVPFKMGGLNKLNDKHVA